MLPFPLLDPPTFVVFEELPTLVMVGGVLLNQSEQCIKTTGSVDVQMVSIVSYQSCQTYNRVCTPPPLKNIMIIVSGPITICSEDIAKGVKSFLSAELSSMNTDIQNIDKSEVQKATQPLQEKTQI